MNILSVIKNWLIVIGWSLFAVTGTYAMVQRNDKIDAQAQLLKTQGQLNTCQTNRATEANQNSHAYSQLQSRCDTEAVAALQSGREIESIIDAPPPPAGQHSSVTADELRHLVGQ